MKKVKELIRLRSRLIKNGCKSLYLDYYNKGVREYEYLSLYLIPEHTPLDRERNKETMRAAEMIKAKRIIEKQNGIAGIDQKKKVSLYQLIDLYVERKKKDVSQGSFFVYSNSVNLLREFQPTDIPLVRVDREWCERYGDFLLSKDYTKNYVLFQMRNFRSVLKFAEENGFIFRSPARFLRLGKKQETKREYLTFAELSKLSRTDCKDELLKRAFLFSCLTGLRLSDIEKLTWGEVVENGDAVRIVFNQKKTGGLEYLDVSKQASVYLGERGDVNALVFEGLKRKRTTEKLCRWAKDAAINKHLTFHSGRHTFAVVMLEFDADLFTISKLLGHKDIKTTQIYAKILDKKKQDAVNKIPEL